MGTNFGESGTKQGLGRRATKIRNSYIQAVNEGRTNDSRKLANQFKRETGSKISAYVNVNRRRK